MTDWPPPGIDWYYADDWTCIACADCRDVLPKLPKVDLIVTDPPYSISKKGVGRWEMRYGRTDDLDFFDGDDDWEVMTETVLQSFKAGTNLLNGHGSFYAWCGHRQFGAAVGQFEDAGWSTRFLVWSKACPVPPAPGSGYPSAAELCLYAYRKGRTWTAQSLKDVPKSNVIVCDSFRFGQPGKVSHPTQKPIEVLTPLIRLSSNSGEVVLDMFAGSGSTLLAAKLLGRRSIGIELDEDYAAIAKERLRQEVLSFT